MKRAFVAIILLLGVWATALYAANFWVNKPYVNWSDKEIERMVNNSPWAQKIKIGGSLSADVPFEGSAAGGAGGGGGRGGGRSRGGSGGGSAPSGGGGRSLEIYIRWVSAMPVRQAIARLRYGSEVDSAEAVQELQREETSYILSVAPLEINAVREQYKGFKQQATLNIKGKAPITPAEVTVRLREDGAAAYFFFPKQQNGQALISPDDREVEFLFNMGTVEIKRAFKLKEMVSSDGLAL